MSDPSVSVVIAAFNAARWLPETLDSALAQTHAAREIIVVDDGSTDDTAARIAAYLPRITYIHKDHGGLAAARNAGVAAASGDYIALLDADDLWHAEKLAVQVAVAGRNPQSGLIACDGVEFAGNEILTPHLLPGVTRAALAGRDEVSGDYHEYFIRGYSLGCPAQTLFPRRIISDVGPFADSRAQDYDFYLRASQRYPVTFHRHSLVRWRYSPASMSGPRALRTAVWMEDMIAILKVHRGRCPPQYRQLVEERIVECGVRGAYATAYAGRGPRFFRKFRARRSSEAYRRQHPVGSG